MARKLEVEIVGDASKLNRSLQQSGSTLGKFGKAGVAAAGAAGIGALFYTMKVGIGEFVESQKVMAQTRAVLKSTGGVARVTAKGVDELSESLMKKSGVDDEAISSGQNMLLTFTKIRNEVGKGNDVFNQATKATLDLSVAMGKDMQSSAILVGKALNDPIKGVTALTKAGIQLTDSQKKTIKAMVESGNTMGAQKIILGELNTQFGGSAEALGKTLPGQINIAKQAFANWAGELVAKTIPIVKDMIAWLRDHWPEIRAKIQEMWAAVKPVLISLRETAKDVVATIRTHWGTIGPILQQVVNIVRTLVNQVIAIFKLVAALIRGDWTAAWNALKDIAGNALKLLVQALTLWKDTVLTAAAKIGKAVINGIVNGLNELDDLLKKAVVGLFHKVIDWVKGALGIKSPSTVFHEIGVNMIKGMVKGIGSMGGFLKDAVIKLAKSIPGRVFSAGRGGGAESTSGLVPQVQRAVQFARNMGWTGDITSGFRTRAEQAALYARYLAGGPLAAAPGTSSHEKGQAVDVTDYGRFGQIMSRAPANARLYNRLGSIDPVHYSISGYKYGGTVPGPIGMPQMAVVHGGETITPPSRGRPMIVNLQVGRETLARILVDPLRNEFRQLQRAGGRL